MQQDDVGTSSCVGNKNQSGSTFEMDQAEASGHRPVSLLGNLGSKHAASIQHVSKRGRILQDQSPRRYSRDYSRSFHIGEGSTDSLDRES